jgi:group I intron endonuclease
MDCGIYQIRNIATGQRYIVRSVRVRKRIGRHFTELRGGYHTNLHLQRSFAKYSEGNFVGEPLIMCRPEDVMFYEHLLILGFRSDTEAVGFNKTIATDQGMLTHTPQARERIAEYNRTLKPKYERTPEIKERVAKSLRGRVGVNTGRTFDPEWRAKLAAARKALWADPERGARLRAARKSPSPEVRQKIAVSLRAYYAEKDKGASDGNS